MLRLELQAPVFFFGIWLIWQGYPLHRQAQLEGVLWYIHSMNFEKGRGKGKSKNSSDRLDYLEAKMSELQRAVAEKGQTRTAEELHRLCATGYPCGCFDNCRTDCLCEVNECRCTTSDVPPRYHGLQELREASVSGTRCTHSETNPRQCQLSVSLQYYPSITLADRDTFKSNCR